MTSDSRKKPRGMDCMKGSEGGLRVESHGEGSGDSLAGSDSVWKLGCRRLKSKPCDTLLGMAADMNQVQGNTPPKWLGRSTWALFWDVIGGVRQNAHKALEVARMVGALLRPSLVRKRVERLRELGHCEQIPSMAQLLVASRDQLSFSLGADTREFYRAQGIPWGYHNFRRFVAYPTTMMDPVGLFSSRDTIIQHVLQTFHRHATYDLVLLRAHEGGVAEMQRQLEELADGTHLHQRSLDSLVEDGSYHDRLRRDVPEFAQHPHIEPRPIPLGLVADPYLMLAMDQFKDFRGYTNYAARLKVGVWDVVKAFALIAVNETIGEVLQKKVGPNTVQVNACDADLVARHLSGPGPVTAANGPVGLL